MERIRPETEVDRTQAALATFGATLPLRRGDVEIVVDPLVAESPVGQRLLVVLANELARMKGIVERLHVCGVREREVLLGVPLAERELEAGLTRLVAGLNGPASDYRAAIEFEPARDPAARVLIGGVGDGLRLAADGWRALLGEYTSEAEWSSTAPYGAGLGAAVAAAEVFKRLLEANGGPDPARQLLTDFAYSAFNYGVGLEAAQGPDVRELVLGDLAVVGCGAGGSAALYVLGMQPGVAGELALIEHQRHKLSNLNRYLMTTAADVEAGRHKLATAVDHLARFAPRLHPTLYPEPWEQLDAHPWPFLLSTVDTVDARWTIQERAVAGAEILDGAVLGLLHSLLRVVPGGRCLECTHPYDPELPLKQRAGRWGVSLDTVRMWWAENVPVTREMLTQLESTQGKMAGHYDEIEGERFRDVTDRLECGETPLRTDVPSQAPVLPVSTTPVGVLLAAEIAKRTIAPEAQLMNWLAHDLGRSPAQPWLKWRKAHEYCPRHAGT
jgi:molybdopterin/thiamine biosynthesis adenylyltransferase